MKILTKISIITFLCAFSTNVTAQTDTLSTDAIYLTLHSQYGIHLDSSLAWEYQTALEVAYIVDNSIRDIHVFHDYILSEITLSTNADWAEAWDSGNVWTGDPFIDSLGLEYDLYDIYVNTYNYKLHFNSVFEAWRLGDVYETHSEVVYAEPSLYGGDGDNIAGFQKNDSSYLAFSHGWGDCMAGCGNRYYWMISTDKNGGLLYWEGEPDDEQIPVWNIVNGRINRWDYCFILFTNVDHLYETIINSPKWWERLYAIEVLWRFYAIENQWCRNNSEYQTLWETMDSELDERYDESISIIISSLNDSDFDVAALAQFALDTLGYVSTEPEMILHNFIQLFPSYPNPFNPITTIRFSVVETGYALSIQIYDITGRLVETLINEKLTPGEHEITWNAGQLPSGVYFVRLQSQEFVENQKILLMK